MQARLCCLLTNADAIVSQNVENIPAYANAYIAEHKKRTALHVSTEFWRFDGYWPYSSVSHRKNDWFWFPVDEFGTEISYESYTNHELDQVVVREYFETEMEKLREIDERSDISIMEFFTPTNCPVAAYPPQGKLQTSSGLNNGCSVTVESQVP